MKAEICRRAAAPAAGALPRRADDRPRRHHAEADPGLPRRLQRPPRRDHPAHQPLHGRRRRRSASGCSLIDHGTILYDGSLRALSERYSPQQTITATLGEVDPAALDPAAYGDVVAAEDGRVTLRVGKDRSAQVAGLLLREHGVTDLTIEDPPVEDVIEQVFAAGAAAASAEAALRRRCAAAPAGARRGRSPSGLYAPPAGRGAGPVPVPDGQLRVHARHGRRAGHLPGGLVRGGRVARRRGGRHHARRVRRVLHRLDAGPEHEHRLHAVRVGGPDPAGRAVRPCSCARCTRSTTTCLLRRLEGRRGGAVAADRRRAHPGLPADLRHRARSRSWSSRWRSGART